MGITVQKFGGTSVGGSEKLGISAEQSMTAVADIVRNAKSPVVVASALSDVTNQLLKMIDDALEGNDWQPTFDALRQRHEDLTTVLGVQVKLDDVFSNIYRTLTGIPLIDEVAPAVRDRIQVSGERLSNPILAAYLRKSGLDAEFVDASQLIYTNGNFGNAVVDSERTHVAVREILVPMIKAGKIPVITGFLGKDSLSSKVTSLGRGGSDYTAAIIAEALKKSGQEVDSIDIYTDVNGIYTADPRIVPGAKSLGQVSYDEAAQIASHGGKVLFPRTMAPAIRAGIKIKVLNTFNPDHVGTTVDSEERKTVKAVTCKKGVSIITVKTLDMFDTAGFLAKLYGIFDRHQVSVDLVSDSAIEVSSSVDVKVPDALIRELKTIGKVAIKSNQAVISLVGHGINGGNYGAEKPDNYRPVSSRFLDAVDGVDTSMVSASHSATNFTVAVDACFAEDVVKRVHAEFFEQI